MAKQKRPGRGPESRTDRSEDGPTQADAGKDVDASMVDQGFLGNQALLGRLASESDVAVDGVEAVREAAFPLVERAILALQLVPQANVDHLVSILEASKLDRRDLLADRLRSNEEAAQTVQDAVVEHFGADSEELRSELLEGLDGIWHDLRGVELDEDGFSIEGAQTAWAGGDRADALIEGLVGRSLPDRDARSVSSFCHAVHLAVLLDEEEEEEGSDYAVEETL